MTNSFTLAILPDTQIYVDEFPHVFTAQTQWLARKGEELNIAFVLHEGDVTHKNNDEQWRLASASMSELDGALPYAIVTGNHDMGPTASCENRESPFFAQHFPIAKYRALPTFGGSYESDNLSNAYHLFEAGGVGWLIVALEYLPRDGALEWANDVIASHADRLAIMLTHSHVAPDGYLSGALPAHDSKPDSLGIINDAEGANDGQETWQKMLRRHANARFAFNGHFLGSARTVDIGAEGNAVHQMLANFQHLDEGGGGYMRLVTCDPSNRRVKVETYSPHLDARLTDAANDFTIEDVDFG